ncbi:MAG: type II secretion system F family protein [Bacillaceae bacterium]|nr:type II secretion system F family protein [Bacillaceae bacterium]
MLYLAFFFTVTLLIYGLFVFQQERNERVKQRISRFFKKKKTTEPKKGQKKRNASSTLSERILVPVWKEFKRSFKRKMPGEKQAKCDVKLSKAGNPFGMTPVEFRLLQISLFLLLPVLSFGYAKLLHLHTGGAVIFVILGLTGAFALPHLYLNMKIRQRNQLALKELPDVLDLLTVSLEAGLGFDSAISKLVSKKDGVLSDEFHRFLEEIRLGKTRKEALNGIRERIEVDEVKMVISSILQAEKLGVGMVQVLRVQSSEVREQRKQRAEEQAMKVPIKMLFPLVLFIFPSIFIVLLGPAVIDFMITFNQ